MRQHEVNARLVVDMLTTHPAVAPCCTPGCRLAPAPRRRGPPDARVRRHGVVPAHRRVEAALEICRRTTWFTLAESLGGVESLIELPAQMTHMSVAGSELEVPADLVRLSVGIEDGADLVEDLRQALG